jgi:hypothetical protein
MCCGDQLNPPPIAVGPMSIETINVRVRQSKVASSRGSDADRVNFVGHKAVRAFTHVHYDRGYRLPYLANPKKLERAFLAAPNV